ncbi:hypothetical protein [Culicoidibacter larvae]|uniref:Uncharacterized protein n=1 Tax=Culicoidibacter larvae TaxID=2579976 RepID=A0A5R8QAM2_9FIRM|nr:hypothetical protein [Culicoidibacter larvae]TLG72953.1 hypothetical protein FEZ08_07855 [Culicoidibacter larvae]
MFNSIQSYELIKKLCSFYGKQKKAVLENKAIIGKYEYVLAQFVHLQLFFIQQTTIVSGKLNESKRRFLNSQTLQKLLSRISVRPRGDDDTLVVFVNIDQVLFIVWELTKKDRYAKEGDIVRGPPHHFYSR